MESFIESTLFLFRRHLLISHLENKQRSEEGPSEDRASKNNIRAVQLEAKVHYGILPIDSGPRSGKMLTHEFKLQKGIHLATFYLSCLMGHPA